ncbi:hypothetical protein SAMN04488124_2158 [Halogeometricum limi]|uniref:Ig-like domain-containing protein n=1 Tax=Halogeometricum limi TaxID=555875 RepID=A0A1I6HEU0_9EURY|nr:hypothetical protein SAMN04488124_2158 [Halogeometricum limi]
MLSVAVAGCGGRREKRETGTRTRTSNPTTGGRTASETPEGPPSRAVRVSNDTTDAAYVSVVVADGGTTRFIESAEVPPGETRSFGEFPLEAGTYDVVVETADGRRQSQTWAVTDDDTGLAARVEPDGVTVVQQVYCELDCPPVSRGGRTAWSERPPARGTVELRNEGSAARTVGVRLLDGDETLAEYEYAVPANTTLAIPAYGRGSGYRVVVERGGESASFDWGVGGGDRLYVDVTETDARFRCGWRNRDLRVVNEDETAHRLTVSVLTDGDTLFEETYDLGPGETVLDPKVVENAGSYEFRIRSERGDEASYVWEVCPPRGPVWVVVDEAGVQVSVRAT